MFDGYETITKKAMRGQNLLPALIASLASTTAIACGRKPGSRQFSDCAPPLIFDNNDLQPHYPLNGA